jgi:hypothetical protein
VRVKGRRERGLKGGRVKGRREGEREGEIHMRSAALANGLNSFSAPGGRGTYCMTGECASQVHLGANCTAREP